MTMERLLDYGSISPEAADLLKTLVAARYNIFVSGGTGAGKTTFLNALSEFIPPGERVITIEDAAELQLNHIENLVRMETREANAEGAGAIGIGELIRAALRMRPDRLIIGEVRGKEALDLLQSLNTGHDGGFSSGHANSVKDMLSRLETMVLMAADLPLAAIRSQIASAVDIMVHVSRMRDKTRKVTAIEEVDRFENGEIILNPLFTFREAEKAGDGFGNTGKVEGSLEQIGTLKHREKLRLAGYRVLDVYAEPKGVGALRGRRNSFGSGAGLCVLPEFSFDFAYFSGGDPVSAGLKEKAEAEADGKTAGRV